MDQEHVGESVLTMNPLQRYRQAQRRLRSLFDPFTQEHCPTCPTPCCRQPVQIRPVDLLLAQECGAAAFSAADSVEAVAPLLSVAVAGDAPENGAPCQFLGVQGCTFPRDLRPFGCSAFVCEPMRRLLPPDELARVEAAVARLEYAHARLMDALHLLPPSAEEASAE